MGDGINSPCQPQIPGLILVNASPITPPTINSTPRTSMNPGTLIADIDHLKEVPVQTGIPQGLLKERLMGTRRTGCSNKRAAGKE